MISIIICSVNQTLLNNLKLNIEDTIGIDFEIIAIDNRNSDDGICKVYNRGGARAKFPVLCFIHEDILFQTQDWGKLVLHHLKNPGTGMIGVAGGDTKGIVPSLWSATFHSEEINLVQHDNCTNDNGEHIFMTKKEKHHVSKKVVSADGVFLCMTKDVFGQFKFDEINFTGFHGYDMDYSLQVLSKYNVVVVFDILIHHYSTGKQDRPWIESAFTASKKWKKYLPVSVYPLTAAEFNFYHWKSLQVFLQILFNLNYSYPRILFYYFYYSFTKYFTARRFLSMGKFVILSMFKKPSSGESKKLITDKKSHQLQLINGAYKK